MNILTRKEAKNLGLSKYLSGKLCKNGHLAERYTASGACSECVSEAAREKRVSANPRANTKLTAQNDDARQIFLEKKTALSNLVQIRELVHEKDRPMVNGLVKGICIARYPILGEADIPNIRPVSSKLYEHHFLNVPEEDIKTVREMCMGIWAQTPKDFSHIHERMRSDAAKEEATQYWPDGRM